MQTQKRCLIFRKRQVGKTNQDQSKCDSKGSRGRRGLHRTVLRMGLGSGQSRQKEGKNRDVKVHSRTTKSSAKLLERSSKVEGTLSSRSPRPRLGNTPCTYRTSHIGAAGLCSGNTIRNKISWAVSKTKFAGMNKINT